MTELAAGVLTLAVTGSWLLAGLAVVLTYVVTCWWWPYGFCVRCGGKGKFFRSNGRAFRDCSWCGGNGRRFRMGAVLLARARSGQDR